VYGLDRSLCGGRSEEGGKRLELLTAAGQRATSSTGAILFWWHDEQGHSVTTVHREL
jgi:hypothetical protein